MRACLCLIALSVVTGSSQLAAQNPTNAAAAAAAAQAVATAATSGAATTPDVTVATVPPPAVPLPTVLTPVTPIDVTLPLQPGNLRITNLSTRARVTPDNPLVTGFALQGNTSRTLLVRVAGPALAGFGVSDAVPAPQLRVYDRTGAVISENAGWSTEPLASAAIAITGAFPFSPGSADSAVVVTLAPGTYTVQVIAGGGASTGSGQAGGVALVEVYDVEGNAPGSRLSNVSTLGTVATAGGEMISGFVLAGTGTKQFLVRGVGPGLAKVGVTGVLADPMLTLFDSTGRPLVTNDDWNGGTKPNAGTYYVATASSGVSSGATTSTVSAGTVTSPVTMATTTTGAFPLEVRSYDAALVTTLGAGAYTVLVNGNSLRVLTPTPSASVTSGAVQAVAAGNPVTVTLVPPQPGVALLEIYEVP